MLLSWVIPTISTLGKTWLFTASYVYSSSLLWYHNVYCHPSRCSTVYVCEIVIFVQNILSEMFFLESTGYSMRHSSQELFLVQQWAISCNTIYYCWVKKISSEPFLCYTANDCGAVNMQILCSYPMFWPLFFSHYVLVSFVCHSYSVWELVFWVIFCNKGCKIAAYKSVSLEEKYYIWGILYNLLSRYFVNITGELSCLYVLLDLCLTLLWIYNMVGLMFLNICLIMVLSSLYIYFQYLSGIANVIDMSCRSDDNWWWVWWFIHVIVCWDTAAIFPPR